MGLVTPAAAAIASMDVPGPSRRMADTAASSSWPRRAAFWACRCSLATGLCSSGIAPAIAPRSAMRPFVSATDPRVKLRPLVDPPSEADVSVGRSGADEGQDVGHLGLAVEDHLAVPQGDAAVDLLDIGRLVGGHDGGGAVLVHLPEQLE